MLWGTQTLLKLHGKLTEFDGCGQWRRQAWARGLAPKWVI